jgi:hypothetical protein
MNETLEAQRDAVTRAVYAAIGAPVVTGRKMKDIGSRFAVEYASTIDEWAAEGRKVTEKLQDQKVVEQVQDAVDLEQIQEQVERLRDQLETAMVAWRDNFAPSRKPEKPAEKKTKTEPAAKKTEAKSTSRKTTPKPTAKKTETKPAAE